MIAKSINAASNPSSLENRAGALNSMQETESVKFINPSRGVLWGVHGMSFRDTLIDGLMYLMNLILYKNYKYLSSVGAPLRVLDGFDGFEEFPGPAPTPRLIEPDRTPLGSGESRILGRMLNSPRPLEPRGGHHVCLQGAAAP